MSTATPRRRPIPLFPTLAGYQRRWLGRDILAGASAGAVVIPQAMAYATIAELPVQAGLYTCIVPMFVYAMLGGSRAMSVSTTSTIATLTATTLVSAGVASQSDDIPRDLVTLTLLVGATLLVARLLRLGSLVEIINRPTLLGIQVGVGATVAVGQLPKLLGETAEPTGHGFIRSIVAAIEALPAANLPTILLSVGSIAVLLLFKRFLPRAPAALIVVAAGILLVAFGAFAGTEAGIARIPPVPGGFPLPALPTFDHIFALLPGAFAISVMAFLESSAVARGIRKPGDHPIDSNQELLATAGANLIGGFFQTLPAAGGFSQSAVNRDAGARSQLAGIVTVALAVLVGLFLGPVISLLPQATLAALVFVAVIGLIDVRTLARLWRISRRDFWVAMVTAIVGLTAGLLVAVAAGVVLTLILVLAALNKPRIAASTRPDGVLTVTLLAPLYTANVLATEQAVLAEADTVPDLRILVLDMAVLQEISFTVLETLEDLDRELAGRGVELRLARLPVAARDVAERTAWFAGLEQAGRVDRP
ncbi:SulP family inorganic anion transporter [Leifsonia sp. NPDC058248]|uniref:SulP family inorganic anion transporter n=1 Tax=Leifsonia sp. NPDC058248 TaxID=3346402 RepID=UPI0036D7BC0E